METNEFNETSWFFCKNAHMAWYGMQAPPQAEGA